MKAVQSHHHINAHKGDFGVMSKSRDWQDAPWSWVRKNYPGNKLRIKVSIWPRQGEPIDRALTQEFTPDSLKAARGYAQYMIEKERAVLASVDMEAYAYSRRRGGMDFISVESELWEPQS